MDAFRTSFQLFDQGSRRQKAVGAVDAEPVTKWERQSRHFQVAAALASFPIAHSVYTLNPTIGPVAPTTFMLGLRFPIVVIKSHSVVILDEHGWDEHRYRLTETALVTPYNFRRNLVVAFIDSDGMSYDFKYDGCCELTLLKSIITTAWIWNFREEQCTASAVRKITVKDFRSLLSQSISRNYDHEMAMALADSLSDICGDEYLSNYIDELNL